VIGIDALQPNQGLRVSDAAARLEQDVVDPGKDGGVGRNSDGHCEHGDCRETRAVPKKPGAVTQILE